MTGYACVIDAMLVFEDSTTLLVSEYEADQTLKLLWLNINAGPPASSKPKFRFVNLPYAEEALGCGGMSLVSSVPLSIGFAGDDQTDEPLLTTACELFNGDTMFGEALLASGSGLRVMLHSVGNREEVLQEFVAKRWNSLKWTRSRLFELCREMDLEDRCAPK